MFIPMRRMEAKMKTLIFLLLLLSAETYACSSDYDCGVKEKCVGANGFQPGVCAKEAPNPYADGNQPIQVDVYSCRNNMDCPSGTFCRKPYGKISGTCQ
jgi:hypothetical protein